MDTDINPAIGVPRTPGVVTDADLARLIAKLERPDNGRSTAARPVASSVARNLRNVVRSACRPVHRWTVVRNDQYLAHHGNKKFEMLGERAFRTCDGYS